MARFKTTAGLGSALIAVVAAFLVSCGGGTLEVPPVVNINPTPTQTVTERLAELGVTQDIAGLYQAYDAEGTDYMRVVWKDPAYTTFTSMTGSVTFGVAHIYVKPWIIAEGRFVEKDIVSFRQVQTTLTGVGHAKTISAWQTPDDEPVAKISSEVTELLYEVLGAEVGTGADGNEATVGTGFDAQEWVSIWDELNGSPLATVADDYKLDIEVQNGIVRFRNHADGLIVAASWVIWQGARAAIMTGGCPWKFLLLLFHRTEGTTPLPDAYLNPYGPGTAHAGDNITLSADSNVAWTATWLAGGYHASTNGSSFTVVMPDQDLVITFTGGGLTRTHTVTLIANPPPINHAPVLDPTGPTALLVDEAGTWRANATDQDGDALTYTWTLNGMDGGWHNSVLNYTFVYPHEARVYVSVEDGRGGEAHHEWWVTITEPEPQGPTWGGEPFDQSKLWLDVSPDGPEDTDGTHVIGLDSTYGEVSNPFIGSVWYDGKEVIPGAGGKFWSVTITTTAPDGTLSTDWTFDSAVCGPGVYYVTLHFRIETLPDALDDLSITRKIRVD